MEAIWNLLGEPAVQTAVLGVLASAFLLMKRLAWVEEWRVGLALDCLEAGVGETYESYVRTIKQGRADGKLTDAERAEARQRALTTAIEYARQHGVDLLSVYAKEMLPVLIEKFVKKSKVPLPLPSALAPELL